MLALAPKAAVGRDRLAATLWPDRAEEQARASLRQELSVLRRALGSASDIICADATSVRLDSHAFSQQFGNPSDGEFLEDLDLRSEPFDDWKREEAARLAESASMPETGGTGDAPAHSIFDNPSVLLIGFVPASSAEEDVAFATGLVIDLRTSLSLWRWYPVIGPETLGWKTERDGDLRRMAESVGASYVISGAILSAGERIRVSAALTDATSGHLVWTETFDGDLSDIFEMQEVIGRAVAARVTPEIGRAETSRILRRRPSDMTAWQLVAQTDELERTGGEGYGSPESNRAQVPLLEAALELEPDYARAWVRLGRYYFRSGLQGWTGDRAGYFKKALEYCQRAVDLDPGEWEGQAYHALTMIYGMRAFGPGRLHAEEAVRLNPSAPTARHALGCALEWLGKPEKALPHLKVISKLNPNYHNRAAVLGDVTTCELFLGNMREAIAAARELRDIAPEYCRGLQRVAVTLGHAGMTAEAYEALQRVLELQPDFDEAYVRETYPYVKSEHIDLILEGLRRSGWNG